jgi:hypothetical protein
MPCKSMIYEAFFVFTKLYLFLPFENRLVKYSHYLFQCAMCFFPNFVVNFQISYRRGSSKPMSLTRFVFDKFVL